MTSAFCSRREMIVNIWSVFPLAKMLIFGNWKIRECWGANLRSTFLICVVNEFVFMVTLHTIYVRMIFFYLPITFKKVMLSVPTALMKIDNSTSFICGLQSLWVRIEYILISTIKTIEINIVSYTEGKYSPDERICLQRNNYIYRTETPCSRISWLINTELTKQKNTKKGNYTLLFLTYLRGRFIYLGLKEGISMFGIISFQIIT